MFQLTKAFPQKIIKAWLWATSLCDNALLSADRLPTCCFSRAWNMNKAGYLNGCILDDNRSIIFAPACNLTLKKYLVNSAFLSSGKFVRTSSTRWRAFICKFISVSFTLPFRVSWFQSFQRGVDFLLSFSQTNSYLTTLLLGWIWLESESLDVAMV